MRRGYGGYPGEVFRYGRPNGIKEGGAAEGKPQEKSLTVKFLNYIRRTLECNRIVDHSDVVGASPVGAAPTTSSFLTQHLTTTVCAKRTARRDDKYLSFMVSYVLY